MPFHPGILVAALLLILCLGINLTQYPTVREMLCEPAKDAATAPSMPSKQPVPSPPQNRESLTSPKTSKVYKPIPSDPQPELEPPKTEPTKPEPPKTEPTKPEPPKTEPAKPEPPKTELVKPEPSKMEPAKPEPPKTKPISEKPKEKEPVKVEPQKGVPSKNSSESAFLPKVPSSLEKEYWETKDKDINQLAMFAPQKSVPLRKNSTVNDAMKPSQPAPAYANAYQPPVSNPAATNNTNNTPKPKTPTAVWNTIDSALERPIMYESP